MTLAIATATPTRLHVEADGTTEVIVAGTAVKEIAFRIIPVMTPAWGRAWGRLDAVVVFGWHDPDHIETPSTSAVTSPRSPTEQSAT